MMPYITVDTIERPAAEQRELISRAYRYHRRPRLIGPFESRKSYIKQTTAVDAIILARSDATAGRKRYPAPIYPAAGAATADPTMWRDALRTIRDTVERRVQELEKESESNCERMTELREAFDGSAGWNG